MSVINTNITSMIGQQNLNKSQNALQTSMERLSSGLRINSAKDDAAGQAIANRMSSQITGLSQAQRNANDGISIAQTAEGGLNQINENLQRIRELSVQAANGTNSQNDLSSIQDEIDQRLSEIDRISEQTDFNGVKVRDTNDGLRIQVGANDNESITVALQAINRETLGLDGFTVAGDRATTVKQLESDFNATLQSAEFAKAGNAAEYFANSDGEIYTEDTYANRVFVGLDGGLTTTEARTSLDVDTATLAGGDGTIAGGADTNFNTILGEESAWTRTAGTGAASATNNNTAASWEFTLEVDGETFTANIDQAAGDASSVGDVTTVITREDGSTFSGDIYRADDGSFTLTENREAATTADLASQGFGQSAASYNVASGQNAGDYNVDANGNITRDGETETLFTSLDREGNLTLVNESQADKPTRNALETLDTALNRVDQQRSALGAVQNRFEDAINNLSTNETNLAAARSRIEDADYAVEVADMTRAQILQQAGTSVLAQANQIPQNVLSLLG